MANIAIQTWQSQVAATSLCCPSLAFLASMNQCALVPWQTQRRSWWGPCQPRSRRTIQIDVSCVTANEAKSDPVTIFIEGRELGNPAALANCFSRWTVAEQFIFMRPIWRIEIVEGEAMPKCFGTLLSRVFS